MSALSSTLDCTLLLVFLLFEPAKSRILSLTHILVFYIHQDQWRNQCNSLVLNIK
jgi:hypothetical protein